MCFGKVSMSKRNAWDANDTAALEKNDGKVWSHRFVICCTREGKKLSSVETKDVVALAGEETTMENTHGTRYPKSKECAIENDLQNCS